MSLPDNYHMMEQLSPDWLAYRCGKVSASKMSDVMAKGTGVTRKKYLTKLAVERITNTPIETYSSASMAQGTEREPDARNAYSFMANVDVLEVGFIDHPEINGYGCSPDGLVGEDGMIEIKSPELHTHIETWLKFKAGKTPREIVGGTYYKQIQSQVDCAERLWTDFVSYNPEAPQELQVFIMRIPRDDAFIEDIHSEVERFIDDLIDLVAELDSLSDKPTRAITEEVVDVASPVQGEAPEVSNPAGESESLYDIIIPPTKKVQDVEPQEEPTVEAPPEPMLNLF